MSSPSRREFLAASALALVGFAGAPPYDAPLDRPPRGARGTPDSVEVILMQSNAQGSWVSFDPIGLFVEPGTTIRRAVRASVHTTTAYHPRNDHHPLRIPTTASPWDSGYLVNRKITSR